jgi:hypothetical protein
VSIGAVQLGDAGSSPPASPRHRKEVGLPELQRLAADCLPGRTGRQAEFAAFVGWDKSHVTRLKQLGQLVFTDAGLVDFPASLQRLAEHADPGRDAQRKVAAQRRAAAAAPASAQPPAAPPATAPPAAPGADADEPDDGSPKYAASRATKEYWAAQRERVEYERVVGELVRRVDVDKAIADVALQLRQAIENQTHRLADRLVGLDLDGIRARLREDGQHMLGEMSRGFAKRLGEVATGGARGSAA